VVFLLKIRLAVDKKLFISYYVINLKN